MKTLNLLLFASTVFFFVASCSYKDKANSHFTVVTTVDYYKNGKITKTDTLEVTEYNAENQPIKTRQYENGKIIKYRNYKYHGNEIEVFFRYVNQQSKNPKKEILDRIYVRKNPANRSLTSFQISESGDTLISLTFQFDRYHNILRINGFLKKENYTVDQIYKYDRKGYCTYDGGKKLFVENEYQKGKLTKQIYRNDMEEVIEFHEFTYFGDTLVEKRHSGPIGMLNEETHALRSLKLNYPLYTAPLIIKEIHYSGIDEIDRVITRTIVK